MSDVAGIILIVVFVVLLFLGGILYVLWYLTGNVFNPAGKGADGKTRRIMQTYAFPRRFKVLSDITLEVDGKSVYIQNMLIGFFGILMVHTLGARGEYYGSLDGKEWITSEKEGKNRKTFPNPILEQQRAASLMRQVFSKHKLYNIPIENIIYVSSRAKATGVFITHKNEILLSGKLKGYLQKTKFDADLGMDVEKITAALTEYSKK